MRSNVRPLLATLLSLLMCGPLLVMVSSWSPSLAQEVGGSLQGLVTREDGTPIAQAEITVEGPVLMVARKTTTDRDGRYVISALPVGSYTVQVSHPDFTPAMFETVVVRLGATTALPAVTLAAGSPVEEHVVVTARRPLVDPVSTDIGGTVSDRYFENLPLDRSYQSIMTLLPSVEVSYLGDGPNAGGSTGMENRYFIDGMDMTDPYRGLSGTNLPRDFIQEVEVKTGGYEAEYRSALGGVVNVVTPSGGDRLAGKLFGYYAGDRFAGEPRQGAYEMSAGGFTQYDVGFSLGGPFLSDRLRFFVAYNPLYEKEDTLIPGLEYYPDNAESQRFAGNLNWQVSPANNLVLTVIGDPTTRDAVGAVYSAQIPPAALLNPDPYLTHVENGGVSVSLRGTHVIGPKFLLESSVSRLSAKDVNQARTARGREEPIFMDFEASTWSGGVMEEVDYESTQLTLGAKGTWSLGRHTLKGGLEYRENQLDGGWTWEIVNRYSDVSYLWGASNWGGSFATRMPSAFVQDSWRIGERLSVNLGLRWDSQSIVASNGRVAQTFEDEFQPRLGAVWQLGEIGSQRLHASAARYYQEASTLALPLYFSENSLGRWCNYDHDPRIDPSGGSCLGVPSGIQPENPDLRGQHFDEFALGYERRVGERHKVGVQMVDRVLREALDDGVDAETGILVWGNPGRGQLAALPRPSRQYQALEITFERPPEGRFGYLASYVLSRTKGNYTGLFPSDYRYQFGYATVYYDYPEQLINGTGQLPNDRTHIFKASGFYRFDLGLNVGSSLVWESGTPLNEFGATQYGPYWHSFIQQRGTAGRTPSIFDLNLRLDYTFRRAPQDRWRPRLILDVYHLFSGREPVDFEQVHYFNLDEDGNQIDPNPNYGRAIRYFPPTTVRLGLEVSF